MESDYQAARLLWLRSGWLKNDGRRNTRETGLAKWFATVASERAAGDAVQIHGANGYSDEYPVGRFYRNCKGAVIYEGTREIHKLMQADYVLGYRQDRPTRCELPAVQRRVTSQLATDRTSPWTPISRSSSCASSNRRPSPARTRWARATATSPTRWRSRRCGEMHGHRADRRHDRHRRRRARRGADALHRREGRHGARSERPAAARSPQVDIAVDPLEGTNLCATGAPNAIAVLAASSSGGLLHAPDLYMEKLVVGPSSKDAVSLDAPVHDNLRAIAQCARPRRRGSRRHRARSPAAREADRRHPRDRRAHPADRRRRSVGRHRRRRRRHGVHAVMGTGGAPEGVLTAAAMRCLNGEIFARLVVTQAGARGALPRDGHHRLQADLPVEGSRVRATTSSSPPPASPTAR